MENGAKKFRLRGVIELYSTLRSRAKVLAAGLFGDPRVLALFPMEGLAGRLALSASMLAWVPLGPTVLSELIGALLATHSDTDVECGVADALRELNTRPLQRTARAALYRATLSALTKLSLERALTFGEDHLADAQGLDASMALARLHVRAGAIRRPLELLAPYPHAAPKLVRRLREQQTHLDHGMSQTTGPRPATVAPANPRRVLYYASQSLPHLSSGYAIRTHYLLQSLVAGGWDPACYARLGFPNDRWDFRGLPLVAPRAEVDGLSYIFDPNDKGVRARSADAYQRAAVDVLMAQAADFRPALLHCASNYEAGQAGTEAARRLGLPSIYEVRGLWHLTRASKFPEYDNSEHYRMSQQLEVQAARRADHVLAITGGVADLLVAGGVQPDRITLLPNAVDPDHFRPRDRDHALAATLGLGDEVILGFVGSFVPYEGLAYLLEATARLRDRHGDGFRVLLVGDGAAGPALRGRARALGIEDRVTFTGRVPHQDVIRYYSLLDVAVYPRVGHPVCELVSPLKPLEALAMAKAVVVSDVGGQREMVVHEQTGLVHRKDDVDSLTDALSRLVESAPLRQQLGEAAGRWVREHRSWSANADTIASVYQKLLG